MSKGSICEYTNHEEDISLLYVLPSNEVVTMDSDKSLHKWTVTRSQKKSVTKYKITQINQVSQSRMTLIVFFLVPPLVYVITGLLSTIVRLGPGKIIHQVACILSILLFILFSFILLSL